MRKGRRELRSDTGLACDRNRTGGRRDVTDYCRSHQIGGPNNLKELLVGLPSVGVRRTDREHDWSRREGSVEVEVSEVTSVRRLLGLHSSYYTKIGKSHTLETNLLGMYLQVTYLLWSHFDDINFVISPTTREEGFLEIPRLLV